MGSLRTAAGEALYEDAIERGALARGCPMCREAVVVRQFVHWRIIPNEYPYDRIAAVHHMIIPVRHAVEQELTDEECKELLKLKDGYLNEMYELLRTNGETENRARTFPHTSHCYQRRVIINACRAAGVYYN